MRTLLPALLILAPAVPAAEPPAPAAPRQKLSAVSLLPDGSQLHGVMFPRYDNHHHLTGVLKAKAMTLVNDDTFSGETVSIELFNDDSSPRGRADLARAVFNQRKGLLNANEPVVIHSDRISAKGRGLCYDFNQGEGFLFGPTLTWIQNPPATTMNTRATPIRATAACGWSLLTLPLTAVAPPAVSPQELAAIHADAASTATTASQAATNARTDLAQDTRDAAAASKAAATFITQAGMPVPTADLPAPEAKPLEIKPGPNDTVITCDGGMYFDADEGLIVYLKNVHVTDPRFDLSGANELKIFLEKKPATPPATTPKPATKPATDPATKPAAPATDSAAKSTPKPSLGDGFGAKFGDVDRIVANGAVRILQKQPEPGKEPIEASGAVFTYHTKTGQIILSGGYPWVKQGATFMRAEQPNLNLRILKTGSFITEGKWMMGGNLQQKP